VFSILLSMMQQWAKVFQMVELFFKQLAACKYLLAMVHKPTIFLVGPLG